MLTKAQIVAALAEMSRLDKSAVSRVLETLVTVVRKELGAEGPGDVTIPNLVRFTARVKPGTEDRIGVNPFTKQPTLHTGVPASVKLRTVPVKALNEMLQPALSAPSEEAVQTEPARALAEHALPNDAFTTCHVCNCPLKRTNFERHMQRVHAAQRETGRLAASPIQLEPPPETVPAAMPEPSPAGLPAVHPELPDAARVVVPSGDLEDQAQPSLASDAENPVGHAEPRRIVAGAREVYERDSRVKARVLEAAGGRCELCGSSALFRGLDGDPYFELHHVRPLAEGGPDVPENAVALCANCHRWLHHGHDREEQRSKLYDQVKRLKRYPKMLE